MNLERAPTRAVCPHMFVGLHITDTHRWNWARLRDSQAPPQPRETAKSDCCYPLPRDTRKQIPYARASSAAWSYGSPGRRGASRGRRPDDLFIQVEKNPMQKPNLYANGTSVAFDLECVTRASERCMSLSDRHGKDFAYHLKQLCCYEWNKPVNS